jgi:hypothetical protein
LMPGRSSTDGAGFSRWLPIDIVTEPAGLFNFPTHPPEKRKPLKRGSGYISALKFRRT